MKLLRLNFAAQLPEYLVEQYSSLVWTERFLEPGEFELKTKQVDKHRRDLPVMSIVSHQDSREIMMVETHNITEDANGQQELVIKGRSLDHYLDYRDISANQYGKRWKMAKSYTLSRAAAVILWNSFINTSGRDVVRSNVFSKSISDSILNWRVTNSATFTGASKRRWLESGPIGPQVLDLLRRGNMGIRTIRPLWQPQSYLGKVVSVTTPNTNKGVYSEVETYLAASSAFDIYNGYDVTAPWVFEGWQDKQPVVFHDVAGHVDSSQYLWSVDDYFNYGWVESSLGNIGVYHRPSDAGKFRGLTFRALHIDGGSPSTDETNSEFIADLDEFGENELKRHKKKELFDGEITPLAPYKYSFYRYLGDYYLGDTVLLQGKYGTSQKMIVSEHTRIEDENGEREFPGLEIPGSDE